MALISYVKFIGMTQGDITGSVTQKGREGTSYVHTFSQEVTQPRDAASGLATGKRQHKLLTLTKPVDSASPLLMTMAVTNENVTKATFKFWRPTHAHGRGSGNEEHFYTIELNDAQIAGIKMYHKDANDEINRKEPMMEQVSLAYRKIIWTYEDGGITAEDDWESPVA